MTETEKNYIEREFSSFKRTNENNMTYYEIQNNEAFELIKIYKHLIPQVQSGAIKDIMIKPSYNSSSHVLIFTLNI